MKVILPVSSKRTPKQVHEAKISLETKNARHEQKADSFVTINDKEQRWMKDQDHKISRSIVNFAIEQGISVIGKLANIRKTARTSRKNEKHLHTWSFYRLTLFIEYGVSWYQR